MIWSRRQALGWGGGMVAALSAIGRVGLADSAVEIRMTGRGGGAEVWFDPIGILVEPGRTIRWVNMDQANAHTATAYHPAIFERYVEVYPHEHAVIIERQITNGEFGHDFGPW